MADRPWAYPTDYYWENDAANEPIRGVPRHQRQAARFCRLRRGRGNCAAAQRVYDFEKRLAEPLLRPADANDPANFYRLSPWYRSIAANPEFDWPAFLEILGHRR